MSNELILRNSSCFWEIALIRNGYLVRKRINFFLNQLDKLYEQANESIRISEAYARLRPNNQSVASSA